MSSAEKQAKDLHVHKRILKQAVALFCATAFSCPIAMVSQDQRGDWAVTGGDSGQSGWQKDEQGLSPETAAASFKLLWKIKLGQPSKNAQSFSEPLLAGRLINAQGFKDIVYWASADTLYAVDSELGSMIWKKQFKSGSEPSGCEVSSLSYLMEPPIAINFNARRRRAPGTPRPPDPPVAQTNERRLGVPPGGGYFGLKGIYVLTPDGMLHEQVMTTGADFAPPVKFLPAANGSVYGLNFAAKTIYAATGRDCGGVPNGIWAIDLTKTDYPVASYATQKLHPLALTGPAITADGAAIFVTGPGTSDSDLHPNTVILADKDMKAKDWYTPEGGIASIAGVSPITFVYKDKQLVVAPGKDGSIALLDAASLGGSDHHTPLFETAPISKPGEKHSWDGFASWTDKENTTWVYASISAAVSLSDNSVKVSGPAPHGAVVAFQLEDTDGKLALKPAWVSPDMVNPAPPRIANGVVVALSGGDTATHATLYVLNAATGAQLYSSKNEVPTYTHLSGVAVGDSHALFTDHENVLYSFGIPLEH
jgi:outer membrane protein assembly factor BamB